MHRSRTGLSPPWSDRIPSWPRWPPARRAPTAVAAGPVPDARTGHDGPESQLRQRCR